MQNLLVRASADDKEAQLELGMRYILGKGVPKDCVIGRKLLRQAAASTGGTIWVYSPPVTKGGAGRVIPINRGPIQPGLQTASMALAEIEKNRLCVE